MTTTRASSLSQENPQAMPAQDNNAANTASTSTSAQPVPTPAVPQAPVAADLIQSLMDRIIDLEQREQEHKKSTATPTPKSIATDPASIPRDKDGKPQTVLQYYDSQCQQWLDKVVPPDNGFTIALPLATVDEANTYIMKMEMRLTEVFDSIDAVSRHYTLCALHRSVIEAQMKLQDTLTDPAERRVCMEIMTVLRKTANDHERSADNLATKSSLPTNIRVVPLSSTGDLTNFPHEALKIVRHYMIPRHLYFQLILQMVETASALPGRHPTLLPALANLNKLNTTVQQRELRKKSLLKCIDDCGFTTVINAPIPHSLQKAMSQLVKPGFLVTAFSELENSANDVQNELDKIVKRNQLDSTSTIKLLVYQLKTAWALNNMIPSRTTDFTHKCHDQSITHDTVNTVDGQSKALDILRDILQRADIEDGPGPGKRTASEPEGSPDTKKDIGSSPMGLAPPPVNKKKSPKKKACPKCKKTADQSFHRNILNQAGEVHACPFEPKGKMYHDNKANWTTRIGEAAAKRNLAPQA